MRRIRAVFAASAGGADRVDLLDQPLPQAERRHEELAKALRTPEAGDVVEEVGDVRGDLLVGGEETEVLVDPGGQRVVVARAEVDVAPERSALAAYDERRLRVDLEAREPVDDVDAGPLDRP